MQILTLVSRGVLPIRLPEQPLSDEAWDLIQRCWVREPSSRPTMKEVTASILVEILRVAPLPSPTPSSQVRKLNSFTNTLANISLSISLLHQL